MHNIPEEAVKAALETYASQGKHASHEYKLRAALTAALPFLPVQGAVKKLEWTEVSEPNEDIRYTHITANSSVGRWSIEWKSWKDYDDKTIFLNGDFIGNGGDNLEAAKAAAQADYEARILSALEPSEARELALEALKTAYASMEGSCSANHRIALNTVDAAIRALSSPDRADAGKVEGDVEKWSIREIVAKAIAYHSVGDPHARTIRGDQRWEWFVEEADKFISVFGYYLPAIPSAPASEGAE